MRANTLIGGLLVAVLAGAAPAGAADEPKGEVRTWTGQAWRLGDITLDLFYTIVPPGKETGATAATGQTSEATSLVGGVGQGRASTARMFGSSEDLGALFNQRMESLQGHRHVTTITLSKDGVETRIPVERIASLLFFRQPIWNSTLPPYVAPSHFRYSATAVLTDGSRVEGDYVNLGTLRLRGTTAQGRVDVSWEDVEVVRFER